ncbi:hypothetical protein PoB_006125600 [Plakobranchus ocellatus]|uniref:Uncharacterized protein n=1 Tax=Plakobranchus ocellatus TaxID=259542 RepID=A0AAV4CS81_9GAST|nr:hypothetical protein PoB_006125600 [Plakobranchus ocellatus]
MSSEALRPLTADQQTDQHFIIGSSDHSILPPRPAVLPPVRTSSSPDNLCTHTKDITLTGFEVCVHISCVIREDSVIGLITAQTITTSVVRPSLWIKFYTRFHCATGQEGPFYIPVGLCQSASRLTLYQAPVLSELCQCGSVKPQDATHHGSRAGLVGPLS